MENISVVEVRRTNPFIIIGIAIVALMIGATGMWLYSSFRTTSEETRSVTVDEVSQETVETISTSTKPTGTVFTDDIRLPVAWASRGPFPGENYEPTIVPLTLMGRGIVRSPTDPTVPESFRSFKDSADLVAEPPEYAEYFYVFEMTEMPRASLLISVNENFELFTNPVNPEKTFEALKGGTVYVGCYIPEIKPEELMGKEVEVPASHCGWSISVKARLASGRVVDIGQFFH